MTILKGGERSKRERKSTNFFKPPDNEIKKDTKKQNKTTKKNIKKDTKKDTKKVSKTTKKDTKKLSKTTKKDTKKLSKTTKKDTKKPYNFIEISIFKLINNFKNEIETFIYNEYNFLRLEFDKPENRTKYNSLENKVLKKLIIKYTENKYNINLNNITELSYEIIKDLNENIDNIINNYLKNDKTKFYASMWSILKQHVRKLKLSILPEFYQFEVFNFLIILLNYYDNKSNIDTNNKLQKRIINMYANNLERKDWCLSYLQKYHNKEFNTLINILKNNNNYDIKTNINDEFVYETLLTDNDIEKLDKQFENVLPKYSNKTPSDIIVSIKSNDLSSSISNNLSNNLSNNKNIFMSDISKYSKSNKSNKSDKSERITYMSE